MSSLPSIPSVPETVETSKLVNAEAKYIGSRIKMIRSSRKLSRAELGSMVGLDQNRVQQYENGRRKPKFHLLKKFADALGVDVRALSKVMMKRDLTVILKNGMRENRKCGTGGLMQRLRKW